MHTISSTIFFEQIRMKKKDLQPLIDAEKIDFL